MATLLVRADGSRRIGFGHVLRTLALAQEWRRLGGKALFAAAELALELHERFLADGCKVSSIHAELGTEADCLATMNLARASTADWIVLDGYAFSPTYQEKVRSAGYRLMLVDDHGHQERYVPDLLLNQNWGAARSMYPNLGETVKTLLGPHYALLRSEFTCYRGWKRTCSKQAHEILIYFGGTDSLALLRKVIAALDNVNVPGLAATVVCSSQSVQAIEVEKLSRASRFPLRALVDPRNWPELLARADLAIGAAGSTTLERAFLGLPSVVFVLAENQESVAARAHADGLVINLGRPEGVQEETITRAVEQLLVDCDARQRMAALGQEAVDGYGAWRVVQSLLAGKGLRLRSANEDDARLIYEWANDPVTRAWSFTSERIEWEGHQAWFKQKLSNPECSFYLACDQAWMPFGQARFDVVQNEAVISVGLAAIARGASLGHHLIRLATRQVLEERPGVREITALIKPENQASLRAFARAGYKPADRLKVRGEPALRYTYER